MQWAAIEQDGAAPGNMSHLTDPPRLQVVVPSTKLTPVARPPGMLNEITLDDLRSIRRNRKRAVARHQWADKACCEHLKIKPVAA